MAYIHGVYIADGFADDCDELIQRCLREGTLTFEIFSDIWQDMQMSCLFHGRNSGAEIAELSEEVIHIAKHYMVADTSNFEESVAGLFLVYSLLNLQPFANFACLRIVQEDVPAIERIEVVARRERRQDVLYILGSVLIQGPVQYQAVLRERGMEFPIRKYLEGYTTIDKMGIRPKGIFFRQNPELDLIRELKNLTVKYTKTKANIAGVKPQDRNLSYLNPEFPNELDSSLKAIISGFISQEKGDEENSDSTDDANYIKNLKNQAMQAKVKPIRHRIGVSTRSKSNPVRSDIKTSPGKVKTISPKKVSTSARQRPKKPPSRKRVRNPKYNSSDSDDTDDYILKNGSDNNTAEELDLTRFHKVEKPRETLNSSTEQEVDIKIDTLPCFITSEDQGKSYEIEIIDHLNASGENEEEDYLDEPTPSTSSTPDDDKKKKVTEKRDLKKTIVKSRFKRMGMLPVANFETK